MPNIELNGRTPEGSSATMAEIKSLMRDATYASELVFSSGSPEVMNIYDVDAPFIRIYAEQASLDDHMGDIFSRLEPLGLEFEVVKLYCFKKIA